MNTKNRGVITVEVALVMPVVIGVLFLLYSLAITQYKDVIARCNAMRVANRAAMNWNGIDGTANNILLEDRKQSMYVSDINVSNAEGGILAEISASTNEDYLKWSASKSGSHVNHEASLKQHDPYRFFVELFSTSSQKKTNMNNYMTYQMGQGSAVDGIVSTTSESVVGQKSTLLLFNRCITVTVKNTHSSPIFGFLENMGIKVDKNSGVTAKAKLTDPEEFIRIITFFEERMRKKK